MRIAMLAPINRRVPPRPYGPEEQLISDLVEGLLERGHQVVLFATANSLTRAELVSACPRPLVEWEEDPWPEPRWWEELHISECMVQAAAGNFDIVHNHMHAKALPFLAALKVPILTTLHGSARDKQLHRFLLRYREFPFVAMDQAEVDHLPELNYVDKIPIPKPEDATTIGPMVEQYEKLYNGLVAGQISSAASEIKRITPWGSWEVLLDEPRYKVKRIVIRPGQRLSLQRHQKRDEHWMVVQGRGQVTIGEETVELKAGEAVDIPRKTKHRIGNTSDDLMTFIEVQTGDYFGEDDIERLHDDYGRCETKPAEN